MAVLVTQDWHPPRDLTMDASPSPNPINASVPRQRSSPANDQSPIPSPIPQQQPYPYPVQQQQAGWSPSQQFYPAFYQNQPYPMQGQPQMHPQSGYYDPANAQFAQWAHWQMMYNAQQAHQMPHVPPQISSQRSRNSAANSSDYFALNQMAAGFNTFPSGTPPPHPSQLPNGYPATPGDQYGGFHPYRRPQRQGSSNPEPQQPGNGEWRSGPQMGTFQPPYARADAAGSSTSVNSGSTASGSHRPRTNSTQGPTGGGSSSPAAPPGHSSSKSSVSNGHGRGGSVTSVNSQVSSASSPRPHSVHTRTNSSSSNSSAAPRPSTVSTASSTSMPHATATLRKPSPLSQGNFTPPVDRRKSRDDSDLAAMLDESTHAPGVRSGGLKGRLRRALSLNANATLREEDENEDVPVKSGPSRAGNSNAGGSSQAVLAGDDESTATVQKKKSRSLFNSRLNRSTDNISLSSTMSSASMVIRRLGAIGKMARRNSLAGITSLFKDKKDKDDDEGGGKKNKKKGEKGVAAEASVSHVTAELDRSDWTSGPDFAGLSPAARLARQHTLKSNAEAAAKAKAEQEARATAAAAAAAAQQQAGGDSAAVPTTWEKNTTTRQGENAPAARVNEVGMGLVIEDDDSDSDGDSDGVPGDHQAHNYSMDGWDDDEDWGEGQEDEDVTIRADFENANLDDGEEMEPWAINVRRSIEKARRPKKGILKTRADGTSYEQDAYLQHPNPAFTRGRANSYDSVPTHVGELGALALLPSQDPDHIDGIHRHPTNGHTSPNPSLPPLSFDTNSLSVEPLKHDTSSASVPVADKALFSHPNSSAPALSTIFSPNPPSLAQRSATAPAKRLAFATNLSVYDTFPATVYDRRSEPATWSRLTPALAQRIKEELNSYKMEEMEVHAASRVHTQFFV